MLDVNGQKIGEFRASFIGLKDKLHKGISLHTAFVSARTSDKVDALCTYVYSKQIGSSLKVCK